MFEIRNRGSSVGREVLGGATTFMAISYILFVQPPLLAKAGMDAGGVFMATCISSAIACVLMGLMANYPIALAPGMGENFFFVFTMCAVGKAAGGFALSWEGALVLTAIVGAIFLLLSLVGFRSKILDSIPDTLKSGIAAGLGLYIALIGFEWGNLIESDIGTFLRMADMHGNYVALLTMVGLAVTLALAAFHVRGAILLGILITTAATWLVGRLFHVPAVQWHGLVSLPSGLGNTVSGFTRGFGLLWRDILAGHWDEILAMGFILLFMEIFDTVATLVGVASRAGLIVNGKLPKAERALAADAAGSVVGAGLGTSTVTCYIESITGVTAGARTGLAAIVSGACLLAALFFQPLVEMVGGGVAVTVAGGGTVERYPMIAPALIFVGAMMMRAITSIEWEDMTEAVPGFLTIVTIPFAFSISAGIAIGFISYAFAKVITGRWRQCPLIVYIFAVLFILRYALGS